MKRVLVLRNEILATSVLMGLLFSASSFTIGPIQDSPLVDNTPQKKVQRVKVSANKDGKETKIDTTFSLTDEKMIHAKVDSLLKKLDIEVIGSDEPDIIIHRSGKHMQLKNIAGNYLPGDDKFDILYQSGDPGTNKHMKKIIRISDGKFICKYDTTNTNTNSDELISPPPPIPPHSGIRMYKRFGGDPFAFDTNDESIISYDKKDIGKGLEKITIIRKKQVEHQQNKKVNVRVETSDDPKK